MKKFAVIFLLVLTTACSVVRIDTENLDNIVDVVLSKNNTLYNTDGKGYKYYIPCGVNHIDSDDLVETLYYNGEYYYLYVDIVSYYYKENQKYKKSTHSYFSKTIQNGKKNGFIDVVLKDNLYHVYFYYNYAKIEAFVSKDNLSNTIMNASYILSTIKYDRKIIKTILDDEYFTNKTGKYDLFKSDKQETFVLEKD